MTGKNNLQRFVRANQREHYKSYKMGKHWVYAALFGLTFSAGVLLNSGLVARAQTSTEPTTAVEANSTAKTINESAASNTSSANTTANSTAASSTDTGATSAASALSSTSSVAATSTSTAPASFASSSSASSSQATSAQPGSSVTSKSTASTLTDNQVATKQVNSTASVASQVNQVKATSDAVSTVTAQNAATSKLISAKAAEDPVSATTATTVTVVPTSMSYQGTLPNFSVEFNGSSGSALTLPTFTNADFDVAIPNGGNSTFWMQASMLNADELKLLVPGTYQVELIPDAKIAIRNANAGYSLPDSDFVPGTLTVNQVSADATVADSQMSYNSFLPDFTIEQTSTSGVSLTLPDLTDADFEIQLPVTDDQAGTWVNAATLTVAQKQTLVPNSAGYSVRLNTDGENAVRSANSSYSFVDGDFNAGTLRVSPVSATSKQASQATVNDSEMDYNGTLPTFTIQQNDLTGSALNVDGLTNDDFDILVPANGSAPETWVTASSLTDAQKAVLTQGYYNVRVNAAGQAIIASNNPGYTFTAAAFHDGALQVTPIEAQVGVNNSQMQYDSTLPNFTVKTVTSDLNLKIPTLTNADFDVAIPNGGNSTIWIQASMLSANQLKTLVPGTYQVELIPDAEIAIRNANRGYSLKDSDFEVGTLTVTQASADATVANSQMSYDGTLPDFTIVQTSTSGVSLTVPDLTKADFEIQLQASDSQTATWVNANDLTEAQKQALLPNSNGYSVRLTASGEAAVMAANPNYSFDSTAFNVGTLTVNPVPATNKLASQVTVIDAQMDYNSTLPTFTIQQNDLTGSALNVDGLTNDDFDILVPANGSAPETWVTASSLTDAQKAVLTQGYYGVRVNAAGQAIIASNNPGYTFTAAAFHDGALQVTPIEAQVGVNNSQMQYDSTLPNFTVKTVTSDLNLNIPTLTNADFDVAIPNGGNSTIWIQASMLSANQLKTLVPGTYQVELIPDAEIAIRNANRGYSLKDSDFEVGTLTVIPAPASNSVTTHAKVQDSEMSYDGTLPNFTIQKDATVGSALTVPALTAADFEIQLPASDSQTATWVNANDLTEAQKQALLPNSNGYSVRLTAAGEAAVEAANPNYSFADTDFYAGLLTVEPVSATNSSVSQVTVSDSQMNYNGELPTFTILQNNQTGSALDVDGLTNNDFDILFPTNGSAPETWVTATSLTDTQKALLTQGDYSVQVNVAGQAIIASNNPGYTFTAAAFHAGDLKVKPLNANDSKTTQVAVDPSSMLYRGTLPTFSIQPTADGIGSALNLPTLSNADFDIAIPNRTSTTWVQATSVTADELQTLLPGDYEVKLTPSAQIAIENANRGYRFTENDFIVGNLTVDPAPASDSVDTQPSVSDQTMPYGGVTPNFTLQQSGSLLTLPALGNEYFEVQLPGVDGNPATWVKLSDLTPTQKQTMLPGNYKVRLTNAGQTAVQNANPGYRFETTDFHAGTLSVTAVPAGNNQTTQVKVNDSSMTYGAEIPTLTIETGANAAYGSGLVPVTLTNADFDININGSQWVAADALSTAQLGALTPGDYLIRLNQAGQQAVEAANKGYEFTQNDFLPGTLDVTLNTTTDTSSGDNSGSSITTGTTGTTSSTGTTGETQSGSASGQNQISSHLTGANSNSNGRNTISTDVSGANVKVSSTTNSNTPASNESLGSAAESKLSAENATVTRTAEYAVRTRSTTSTNKQAQTRKLPQTNEQRNSSVQLGLSLISLLTLFGFLGKRRKKENER
ncbi:MBG domain-containing protein [Secundilactobacillus folii]|uniref:MBG domain-containing protein n=1 Tax=Secundilactobacillus folii TaxID=2678357 RepID=UPI0015659A22|nr:MBG domain-containing protein [Secundilactobacillus folii]